MKPFGGINLPVTNTQRIKCLSEIDAIDFLLDIHFQGKYALLKAVTSNVTEPQLIVIKCQMPVKHYPWVYPSVVLLIFNPPPIWREFKSQRHIIYVGRLVFNLKEYFINQRRKSFNVDEINAIDDIIRFLDYQGSMQHNLLIQKYE